ARARAGAADLGPRRWARRGRARDPRGRAGDRPVADAAGRRRPPGGDRPRAGRGPVGGGRRDGAGGGGGGGPGGRPPHPGTAGLTLGGGIGWLMRRCGATVDNLIGAEVVIPDGAIVAADDDLLWGLRGGGGNFGVVTEFEYRLHEVGPTVLAGPLYYA